MDYGLWMHKSRPHFNTVSRVIISVARGNFIELFKFITFLFFVDMKFYQLLLLTLLISLHYILETNAHGTNFPGLILKGFIGGLLAIGAYNNLPLPISTKDSKAFVPDSKAEFDKLGCSVSTIKNKDGVEILVRKWSSKNKNMKKGNILLGTVNISLL